MAAIEAARRGERQVPPYAFTHRPADIYVILHSAVGNSVQVKLGLVLSGTISPSFRSFLLENRKRRSLRDK